MKIKTEIINNLKAIKTMDWEMNEIFTIVNNIDDGELYDDLREHLTDNYITNDEETKMFMDYLTDEGKDFDLAKIGVATSGINYDNPINKNVYGNLENTTTENVINELVSIVEQFKADER